MRPYAPEDSELTNGFETNPLPRSEADVIVRRARSGPHGRHARMPDGRASQGPRLRGWGEHATVDRDVPAVAAVAVAGGAAAAPRPTDEPVATRSASSGTSLCRRP